MDCLVLSTLEDQLLPLLVLVVENGVMMLSLADPLPAVLDWHVHFHLQEMASAERIIYEKF